MIYRVLGALSLGIGGVFAIVTMLVLLPFLDNFNVSLLVLAGVFAVLAYVFLAIGWQLFHPPEGSGRLTFRRGAVADTEASEAASPVGAGAGPGAHVAAEESEGLAAAPSDAPPPSVGEPTVTEPTVTEPSVAEPTVAEPSVAEPTVAEPSVAEPSVPGLAAAGPTPVSVPAALSRPEGRAPLSPSAAAADLGRSESGLEASSAAPPSEPVRPAAAPDLSLPTAAPPASAQPAEIPAVSAVEQPSESPTDAVPEPTDAPSDAPVIERVAPRPQIAPSGSRQSAAGKRDGSSNGGTPPVRPVRTRVRFKKPGAAVPRD